MQKGRVMTTGKIWYRNSVGADNTLKTQLPNHTSSMQVRSCLLVLLHCFSPEKHKNSSMLAKNKGLMIANSV
jgi:hypothetical protein